MSFSDIAKPRKEVLSGAGVSSIVDLENLKDSSGRRIEARAEDFLDLTYPTSDIRYVLQKLNERFSSRHQTEGLYLFEGYKGSGKSHLLLFIHHLANSPEAAKQWLSRYQIECALPENPTVITHKFTDFPLFRAWDLIMADCGASGTTSERPPNLDEFRKAIAGKHVFLLLDELERGIQSISDPARQMQNLNFLQMITEEGYRTEDATLTVFAGIYDAAHEPGATLKRVPRIDVKFSDPTDRKKIVLHRLFENPEQIDKKKVHAVMASFRNEWTKKGLSVSEEYAAQLTESFPFSPELIHLIQEQARERFQETRGALGFLGTLVKNCHRKRDLITAADASILDRAVMNRLIDLDPGQRFMGCARNDLDDLKDLPFAERIVSAVLLATLAASGKSKGMTEETIALQVLQPGDDINDFKSALRAFHKLGTYFHEQEGVYYFDPEEKPHAKVEYKSLVVDPGKALTRALEFWAGDLFGDRDAVVFRDVDNAKAELRLRDSKRPRFVLAPRRLLREERHDLYFGLSNRNLIILLEPRNKDFNALENQDIIKWAQRHIAAMELQSSADTAERKRQFERIAKEDKDYILRAFQNAGFSFILVEEYGEKASDDVVEVEPLGNACTKQDITKKIGEQSFPRQRFEEHIRDHSGEILGRRVKAVEQIYKETLGYPVMIYDTRVREALQNLCVQRIVGLRHEKDSPCGRQPRLTDNELSDAIVDEPFEDTRPPKDIFSGSTEESPGTQSEEETKEIEDTDEVESPTPHAELIYLETPFSHGIGELRQQVASKLAEHEEATIKEITFRIYYEAKKADLGSLPAGLRGALSGQGDITADLTISKTGNFSKGEVEQLVESLPSFAQADYKAELKVEMPQEEPA